MLIDCLKEGFTLANRNYQLVFLRIAVVIINFISLLFFLGLPLIAAVTYLGWDLSHTMDLLPDFMEDPFNLLSKYLGFVFLIGISFIIYLIFVSTIILYSLGGTLGALKNSAVNIQYRFSLSSFFREAHKTFSCLFRVTAIQFLLFIILFAVVIISGGLIVGFTQGFSGAETPVEVFFSSFITLFILIFGTIIFLAWLMFMVYSVLSAVIEEKGAVDAIKNTFNFLKRTPQAFLFFMAIFMGAIAINLIFLISIMPLGMLPFINIPLSVISIIFQNYLSLVAWSALIVYYIKTVKPPVYTATYDI